MQKNESQFNRFIKFKIQLCITFCHFITFEFTLNPVGSDVAYIRLHLFLCYAHTLAINAYTEAHF